MKRRFGFKAHLSVDEGIGIIRAAQLRGAAKDTAVAPPDIGEPQGRA